MILADNAGLLGMWPRTLVFFLQQGGVPRSAAKQPPAATSNTHIRHRTLPQIAPGETSEIAKAGLSSITPVSGKKMCVILVSAWENSFKLMQAGV